MNPLLNVSVTIYLKIENSNLFGGEGTTGYMATKYDQIGNIEPLLDPEYVMRNLRGIAKDFGVTVSDVTLISKDEYDCEMGNSYDDCDGDDW